jgi:hypothetical protein
LERFAGIPLTKVWDLITDEAVTGTTFVFGACLAATADPYTVKWFNDLGAAAVAKHKSVQLVGYGNLMEPAGENGVYGLKMTGSSYASPNTNLMDDFLRWDVKGASAFSRIYYAK